MDALTDVDHDSMSRPSAENMDAPPLLDLLRAVASTDYHFITVTPTTHQQVIDNRPAGETVSLRDVFGWNLSFLTTDVAPPLLKHMQAAGVIVASGELFTSRLRIASLDGSLFLHTSFPTTSADAVFFGPDTYRFARFIRQSVISMTRSGHMPRILDVGCGSGAGGIIAARALAAIDGGGRPVELVMNDINPRALELTAINAAFAGQPVVLAQGDALAAVDGAFDLIISNPPYLVDAGARTYRDGGAGLGRALSVRIVAEALARLAPGGQLLLYTGVAIVNGVDPFLQEIRPLLEAADCTWSYDEIDPDIFGDELERPPYTTAERIAAIGLLARRRI